MSAFHSSHHDTTLALKDALEEMGKLQESCARWKARCFSAEAALRGYDELAPVIEAAVRDADPMYREAVAFAVKTGKYAIAKASAHQSPANEVSGPSKPQEPQP